MCFARANSQRVARKFGKTAATFRCQFLSHVLVENYNSVLFDTSFCVQGCFNFIRNWESTAKPLPFGATLKHTEEGGEGKGKLSHPTMVDNANSP